MNAHKPGMIWPEPKFVPFGDSGSELNPARVDAVLDAIRQELVIGEQMALAERLVAELIEAGAELSETEDGS